jgi:hypothetical protein
MKVSLEWARPREIALRVVLAIALIAIGWGMC